MTGYEQRFLERVPSLLHDIAKSLETIAGKKQAEEPKCVWVFTAEQAWDGEVAETIVETFATEGAAIKFMHKFIHEDGDETIEQYVERKEWEVEMDEPDLYRAYDDCRYSNDHIECTITKCEIKQ